MDDTILIQRDPANRAILIQSNLIEVTLSTLIIGIITKDFGEILIQ